MDLQKLAILGILITVIATLALTLLITNSTLNAKSPSSAASLAITAVAETFLSNSTNSTNTIASQVYDSENVAFSPSSHPPSLAPQNKSVLAQAQKDHLPGPTLPSSNESIHGPAPGTASP